MRIFLRYSISTKAGREEIFLHRSISSTVSVEIFICQLLSRTTSSIFLHRSISSTETRIPPPFNFNYGVRRDIHLPITFKYGVKYIYPPINFKYGEEIFLRQLFSITVSEEIVPSDKPTDIPMKKQFLRPTPSSRGCVETKSHGTDVPSSRAYEYHTHRRK